MKAKELRELSKSELHGKVEDISEELARLRFQHGIRPLENTAGLQRLRKDIARIRTVMHEKE